MSDPTDNKSRHGRDSQKSIDDFFPNLGAGSSNPNTGMYLGKDWIDTFVNQTRQRAIAKQNAKACPKLCLDGKSDEAQELMQKIDRAESRQLEALAVISAADLAVVPAERNLILAVKTRIKADLYFKSHPDSYSSRPMKKDSEFSKLGDAYYLAESMELKALAELGYLVGN